MSKPIVYLAGPIAGTDYDTAQHWRLKAEHYLAGLGVGVLSPMRAKARLSGGKISNTFRDYEHNGPFFTSRGITARDLNDLKRADLILAWFPSGGVSYGTTIELAWAYLMRTPVVIFGQGVTGESHPIMRHPMLREVVGDFRAEGLQDALEMAATVLGV